MGHPKVSEKPHFGVALLGKNTMCMYLLQETHKHMGILSVEFVPFYPFAE